MIDLPTRYYRDEIQNGLLTLTADPLIAKQFLIEENKYTEEQADKKIKCVDGFVSSRTNKDMYRICYFINIQNIASGLEATINTNLVFSSNYTNLKIDREKLFGDRFNQTVFHELAHLCMAFIDSGFLFNASSLTSHESATRYHILLSEAKLYKVIRVVLDWCLSNKLLSVDISLPEVNNEPYIYFYDNYETNVLPSYYIFQPNNVVSKNIFNLHPDAFLVSTIGGSLKVYLCGDQHQTISVIAYNPENKKSLNDIIGDVVSEMFLSVFRSTAIYISTLQDIQVLAREKEEVLAYKVQDMMNYQLKHFYSAFDEFIKLHTTKKVE